MTNQDGDSNSKVINELCFNPFFPSEIYKNPIALESDENFRSPQSDIEVPKTRQRKGEGKGDSTATLTLDPLAMTKENMSTSRRPAGTLQSILK